MIITAEVNAHDSRVSVLDSLWFVFYGSPAVTTVYILRTVQNISTFIPISILYVQLREKETLPASAQGPKSSGPMEACRERGRNKRIKSNPPSERQTANEKTPRTNHLLSSHQGHLVSE